MQVQRRGFLGGLLTLPFAGKALAAEAVKPAKPFDVQAAKKAWRNYIAQSQKAVEAALWQGKSLDQAVADARQQLGPPPPHADQKARFKAMELFAEMEDATL